jgi:hypothetical protein
MLADDAAPVKTLQATGQQDHIALTAAPLVQALAINKIVIVNLGNSLEIPPVVTFI